MRIILLVVTTSAQQSFKQLHFVYVLCRLERYKHESVIVNFVRYILDKTISAIVRFIYFKGVGQLIV